MILHRPPAPHLRTPLLVIMLVVLASCAIVTQPPQLSNGCPPAVDVVTDWQPQGQDTLTRNDHGILVTLTPMSLALQADGHARLSMSIEVANQTHPQSAVFNLADMNITYEGHTVKPLPVIDAINRVLVNGGTGGSLITWAWASE